MSETRQPTTATGGDVAVPAPRRPSPRPRGRDPEPPPPVTLDRGPDHDWARGAFQTALALVLGVVVGLLAAFLLAPAAPPPTAPAASTAAAPGAPITLLAQVTGVRDGQTVTVAVGDRDLDVDILGLDAPRATVPGEPAPCGAQAATDLAASTLAGQTVTLVPDPTVRDLVDPGHRRAYVVLRSQLSYTDLALQRGVTRRSTEPLWYADVFAGEERTARAAGAGLWGPPCRGGR